MKASSSWGSEGMAKTARKTEPYVWKRGFRILRVFFSNQSEPYTLDPPKSLKQFPFDEQSFSSSDDAAFLRGLQAAIRKRVFDFLFYWSFGFVSGALLIILLYTTGVYEMMHVEA